MDDARSFVYCIQAKCGGPVKIGVAHDPILRLAGLQIGNPFELRLVGVVPGTVVDEQRLHSKFARFALRGEWFWPHPEIGAFFAESGACVGEFVPNRDIANDPSLLASWLHESMVDHATTSGREHRSGALELHILALFSGERLPLHELKAKLDERLGITVEAGALKRAITDLVESKAAIQTFEHLGPKKMGRVVSILGEGERYEELRERHLACYAKSDPERYALWRIVDLLPKDFERYLGTEPRSQLVTLKEMFYRARSYLDTDQQPHWNRGMTPEEFYGQWEALISQALRREGEIPGWLLQAGKDVAARGRSL